MIKENKKEILYDTLSIKDTATITNCELLLLSNDNIPILNCHNNSTVIKISNTILYKINKNIRVQDINDNDMTILEKFNLTYNPYNNKLEEGW